MTILLHIIIKLALIAILVIVSILILFPSIRVCGDSMSPTYKDGDILLSTRAFSRKCLKVGDVIVLHPPVSSGSSHEFVIKRVSKISKDKGVYFLGDNPVASFDSRNYGYVPLYNLVAKIIINDKRSKKHGR